MKNIVERLIVLQRNKVLGKIAHFLLTIFCIECPKSVKMGENVHFVHRAPGTIIHPQVTFGNNIWIFQGVTIGKSRPWEDDPDYKGVSIGDNCIICAGAKILAKKEIVVGKGTIIGANSVLLESTGENEIWSGIPAKKIKNR